MTPSDHAKVLTFLESLRAGVAVWKLGGSHGLDEAIAIMRREVEPPATPLSGRLFSDHITNDNCGNLDAARQGWNACAQVYDKLIPPYSEPISDAEIIDLWNRTPGGFSEFKGQIIEFARALLEKAR